MNDPNDPAPVALFGPGGDYRHPWPRHAKHEESSQPKELFLKASIGCIAYPGCDPDSEEVVRWARDNLRDRLKEVCPSADIEIDVEEEEP